MHPSMISLFLSIEPSRDEFIKAFEVDADMAVDILVYHRKVHHANTVSCLESMYMNRNDALLRMYMERTRWLDTRPMLEFEESVHPRMDHQIRDIVLSQFKRDYYAENPSNLCNAMPGANSKFGRVLARMFYPLSNQPDKDYRKALKLVQGRYVRECSESTRPVGDHDFIVCIDARSSACRHSDFPVTVAKAMALHDAYASDGVHHKGIYIIGDTDETSGFMFDCVVTQCESRFERVMESVANRKTLSRYQDMTRFDAQNVVVFSSTPLDSGLMDRLTVRGKSNRYIFNIGGYADIPRGGNVLILTGWDIEETVLAMNAIDQLDLVNSILDAC